MVGLLFGTKTLRSLACPVTHSVDQETQRPASLRLPETKGGGKRAQLLASHFAVSVHFYLFFFLLSLWIKIGLYFDSVRFIDQATASLELTEI